MHNHVERMKAIIAQAEAQAKQQGGDRPSAICLIVYGSLPDLELARLFAEASHGTGLEGASLRIERAGSRYICYNCCGLCFEGEDGLCPNCGELALEVPEEISFALRNVEVSASP